MEDHEHHHEHDHELEQASKSARKNKIANLATAAVKFIGGIIAKDPVLASEAGHDLGDASVHADHEREINADSDAEARSHALKSAKKLGAFSLLGAGAEVVAGSIWEHPPNHILGFGIALGSFAVSRFLKKDAHHHTHDRAHSLRSHTFFDQLVSGTTLTNATLLLAGFEVSPVFPIATHLGLSFASSWQIYKHSQKTN